METKHTPGPWYLSRNNNYVRANGAHGWNIAAVEDQQPYTEANAHLISAAPDMFEVIKELYEFSMKTDLRGPIFPKVEAAYLKATGQHSPVTNH